MKQIIKAVFITLLMIVLIQCNNPITNTIKLLPNDPFKNTIVPSQTFEIDSKQDNVVQGKNGTVIVCPKGCFKNGKGEIVEENIKIELSEAFSVEEMILSNLTTTSDGKPLETDGMIYFNATSNDEQLVINKENPVHIEIPTTEKKAGMMAYKGIRDEKGNMNWVEPKELDNYLVTVDINSLDFLPPMFQFEVDKGMPFKNYKTSTQQLTDSLYYSLSMSDGSDLIDGLVVTSYNEPYYNKNKQVVNGKYTKASFQADGSEESEAVVHDTAKTQSNCGIEPAIIKVIKSEKYQNTLIATREFEARLKVIFQSCNNSILEIYTTNLDKNLYELDSMAAEICQKNRYYNCYHKFHDFSLQRLTKVKQADKYAELLKGYYEKQLKKVKKELEERHEKVLKVLKQKNKEAEKLADDYRDLLWKREQYRMETYGFNWTETGWVNIDNGTMPKTWGIQPLEITVDNGQQYDRVYTYVVYMNIRSLYRLNTDDKKLFYVGNNEEKQMLMPKEQLAVAIAIGYKEEAPSIAVKRFETGSEPKFNLTLSPSTLEQVKEVIKPYENYGKENRISKDLVFMAKFYKEEQRQKELIQESRFISNLWGIAYPCCAMVDSTRYIPK